MLDDIRLSGAELMDLPLEDGRHYVFDEPTRAVVYIVKEGEAWLTRGTEPPLLLRASELALVAKGERQLLSARRDAIGDCTGDIGLLIEQRAEIGEPAAPVARVACGRFRYDAEFAAPLMAAMPPVIKFEGAGPDAPMWLTIGLAFLAQERALPRPAQQAVINRLVDILMIECLRDQIDRIPPDAVSWLGALRDPHLSAALAAIHHDPSRNWTVPELSAIANLSRSAFAARFSQKLGQSPMAYVTSHRLRLAARQLRQAALPVKTIAANLGYESTVGFTQAFRREFGYPPSTLRRPGA